MDTSISMKKGEGDKKEDKMNSGEVGGRVLKTGIRNESINRMVEARTQNNHALQKGEGDKKKEKTNSGEVGGRVVKTGIRNESTNRKRERYDPGKYDGNSGLSGGAARTSSCRGKPTTNHKVHTTEESNQRSDNLKFYQNVLLSRPAPGFTIECILKYKGKYRFFDDYPGFIYWLFPVPESTGRNAEAQPLHEHEAKKIRDDDELSSRVLEAFKVMLDFYGMRLCDDVKGKFKRIAKTYKERYEYLQRYTVNYMRITRILKSIGELGLDRFQCPWIDFLIFEGIDNAQFPTLGGQSIQHWIGAIKDEGEKHAMFGKYQRLLGHKALIADTEGDIEVSNDVFSAHNTAHNTHNADVGYARAEGGWGFDKLHFV